MQNNEFRIGDKVIFINNEYLVEDDGIDPDLITHGHKPCTGDEAEIVNELAVDNKKIYMCEFDDRGYSGKKVCLGFHASSLQLLKPKENEYKNSVLSSLQKITK